MRIVVFSGSIRASARNTLNILNLASASANLESLVANARNAIQNGNAFSNSELMAAAALLGAHTRGAEIDYFPLVSLFRTKERNLFTLYPDAEQRHFALLDTLNIRDEQYRELLRKLDAADGVIVSTPVYFGDRSSVANKVMQITARKGLLRSKIFGVVSVGAKRNGGQETCNVYSLIEALAQGALAVGNGPPTSQYGGTAVGGNPGHVLDDLWGLTTAYGTGRKVAHTSELCAHGEGASAEMVRITILITSDTMDRFFHKRLCTLVQRVSACLPDVRFEILQLLDASIYRCLGCKTCPYPGDVSQEPCCRIREHDDYVKIVHQSLRDADGFIVAGLNATDSESVIFRYQVATERMRSLRRNDFELTDKLVTGLSFNQFGATVNPLHNLKVLTSYIRHNTIIHRPIEILEHEGTVIADGFESMVDFCRATARVKLGRRHVPTPEHDYVAHGIAGGYVEQ